MALALIALAISQFRDNTVIIQPNEEIQQRKRELKTTEEVVKEIVHIDLPIEQQDSIITEWARYLDSLRQLPK